MTSKTSKNTNVSAHVATWNAAHRAFTTARAVALDASAKASAAEFAPHRPASLGPPTAREHLARNETRLAFILASTAELEAEAAERDARAIAASACDARDVAAGDPQALACSLEILRDDLAADRAEADRVGAELRAELDAVEARGRAKIEAVKARSSAREAAAREAAAALTAKRDLVGEPGPRLVPRSLGAELDAAIAGPVPLERTAQSLRALRREEIELRGTLEKAHREAEKRAKEHAEAVRATEAAKEANRAENTRLHQEWLAKGKAEKDALVNAHRARTA